MATNNDFILEFIGQLDKSQLTKDIAEFAKQQIEIKVNTDMLKEAIKEFAKLHGIKLNTKELNSWTNKFMKYEAQMKKAEDERLESQKQKLIENARIQEEMMERAIQGILAEVDAQADLDYTMKEMNNTMWQTDSKHAQALSNSYEKIGKKIKTLTDSNVGFLKDNKEINKEVQAMVQNYQKVGSAIASGDKNGAVDGLVQLQQQLDGVTSKIRQTKSDSKSFFDMLKENFTKFGAWSIITVAYFKTLQAMKDAVQQVIELDASLVELRKVTDLSGDSLKRFTEDAFEAGEQVGRTGKEVIDATAEFARSGYSIKDSLNLGKEALTMVNIADNMTDAGFAATQLISILKAYRLEADQARYVNDVLNQVSNTSAISFDDLAEAVSRAGSVFYDAGVDIEHLSGLMVGANEIIQNIEKTSSGLITISQRLRGQILNIFQILYYFIEIYFIYTNATSLIEK